MIPKFRAIAAGGSLAGALVFAVVLPIKSAVAQAGPAISSGATDFSSQQHDPRVSAARRGGQGGAPQGRGPGGPPVNFQRGGPGGPQGNFQGGPRPRGPGFNPNAGFQQRTFGPGGPRGPAGVVGPGFRGPAVGFRPSWRGGRAAFIRGPYSIRRGGLLLPLVGLGALGAIYVGSQQYTPYAFVDGAAGPECQGPTDDGICELRLTEVPLEDGGAEMQCVAYCPPQ
jgi:hypothetical protein